MVRKHYTTAVKAQVVRKLFKEDKTLAQVAAEHAFHPTQLVKWRATALHDLPSRFARKDSAEALKVDYKTRMAALYEEIGHFQNNWLGSKGHLVSTLSSAERRALSEREAIALPLAVQAELLGVSRSSLYYQPRQPAVAEVALKHRIDEIYTQYPFYGSRRIAAHLRREGVSGTCKAMLRHMRERVSRGSVLDPT
jgi:putative transposase